MYTYHRSEHSPGVRFCKYLLAHRLTGRHVCFSCFAFTFCPLPISITLSNILLWTVCLPGLSDRFESKKDGPKTGYQVKEVYKAVNSTTLRMQNIILRKKEFYSVKLPFEPPPPPPPKKKMLGGIFLHLIQLLFLTSVISKRCKVMQLLESYKLL